METASRPSWKSFLGIFVGELVDDMAGPILLLFNLDMDSEILSLIFDEPVETDSLDVTSLFIQSSSNGTQAASIVTLTNGEVSGGNTEIISIKLSSEDVNDLKLSNSSKDNTTTFLAALSGFVLDTAYIQNDVAAIDSDNATQVYNYTSDASPPELLQFNLDLQDETIVLLFSEPVVVEAVNVSRIFLHAESDLSGNTQVLTDGSVITSGPASNEIIVALTLDDIAAVKLDGKFWDFDFRYIHLNRCWRCS